MLDLLSARSELATGHLRGSVSGGTARDCRGPAIFTDGLRRKLSGAVCWVTRRNTLLDNKNSPGLGESRRIGHFQLLVRSAL